MLAASLGASSLLTWSMVLGQRAVAATAGTTTGHAGVAAATVNTIPATVTKATSSPPSSVGTSGVQIPPPPATFQTVANDGILRMDMNLGTGAFQIVDLRNGAVWTSGPSNPSAYALNQLWQSILQGQFDMENTTIERITASNPQNQYSPSGYFQGTLDVTRITNGVAMTYSFTQPAIQYTVDLTIQGAHMIATVPSTSIYEALNPKTGQKLPLGSPLGCQKYPQPKPQALISLYYFPPECYELTSITFLPGFGAGYPGTSGYVVVPDGSGAEITFNAVHPTYTDEYAAPIYGNQTVTPNADEWLPQANLPLYGIVHQNPTNPTASAAMLAVVTQGQGNAEIQVIPAGQRANMYLAGVKFQYRPQFNAFALSGGSFGQELQYEWKPILGTRQVQYFFVDGSQANYSGLAARYRQYLVQTQNVKPLTPPSSGNPPLLLHVLNAIREVGVIFSPLERMTTFAQTADMLTALHSQGVQSVRVSLEGWMKNGLQWKSLPQIWPPSGAVGGTGGLKKLITAASGLGDHVVLSVDLMHAYAGGSGYNVRKDSLHTEDQLYLQDGGPLGSSYLLSPTFIRDTLFPNLMKRVKSLGIAGFDFSYFGRNVYPQLLNGATVNRLQAATDLMSVVAQAKAMGTAGVQGGNAYAVGPSNYFYNAPLTDSGFNFETRSIPFWELVVHGLALYSGTESNLNPSPTQDELQMIEDGALPDWELTWVSASHLRFTAYNQLYTSSFAHWESAAVAQYQQELKSGYAKLAYVAMTANRQLQPGVDETDYANGARVIVNFNNQPVTVSQYNVTVPAQNYVVIGGGGGQS